MNRLLPILLLMLSFTLWGAEPEGVRVPPARIEHYDKLLLYSYSILGVEVRSFTDEEFVAFHRQLKPWPEDGIEAVIEPGQPASLHRKQGLIITRVVPGSPAEKSGLQEGEVICAINGSRMFKPQHLLSVMRNYQSGLPLKMWLIDRDLRWKTAEPRTEARPEPAVVGHIVPRKLCPKHAAELRQHQARAIELLAREDVQFLDACNTLESICRIIYGGATPGCLQIPLRSGDCSIIAIRNGWEIDVIMTENGVETVCHLRQYHYQVPERELCYTLPEAVRQRLLEMDTTGADKAPHKEPYVKRVKWNEIGKPPSPVAPPQP